MRKKETTCLGIEEFYRPGRNEEERRVFEFRKDEEEYEEAGQCLWGDGANEPIVI